jgi:hypothetical protein
MAAPGEHRSTDIGDVLIGRDGQSLQIAADDGLHLKPIASVDRIPSDGEDTRRLPGREVDRARLPEEAGIAIRGADISHLSPRAPSPRPDAEIHVLPGKDNPLSWRDDRSFDIHDSTGKIGYLSGYLGGPWSDADRDTEFRVTHVEITAPGRTLSPGQWKDVLHGLRQHLPDVAELVGGNRGGEGGDLSPAYEKLVRLPPSETAGQAPSPADLLERAGPPAPTVTGGQTHKPKL